MGESGIRCIACGGGSAQNLFRKKGYDLLRCNACGLVFVGNPPSREKLRQLYSFASGYHEKLAVPGKAQAEFQRRAQAQYAFVKELGLARGRVLDVGCSVGLFLACAGGDGWDVAGVEFSPDTAEIARSQLGDRVFTGTLEEAPLEEASFDLVTMWDVLEHVPNPPALLARAHSLLRTDGDLILETPNIDGWFPRASYGVARLLDYWPHPEPPGHLYQFSIGTLRPLLQRAGFDIRSIRHNRIPLAYSFGKFSYVCGSLKRLAYFALFAPLAYLGPWFGAGDSVVVVARRQA